MGQSVITKKLLRYCIVFLIFCSGCECHSSCTCKEHERNVILNFTRTFMFGLFDGIASWGHVDCCYWDGVRCDNVTCNIIALDLFNHSSDSQAPPNSIQVLHELPFLQELRLSSCELTNAHFHQFLSNSTFLSTSPLQVLDFSNNLLHGPIPSPISNLSSLTSLDLSDNQLGFSIPSWLGNMRNLQFLSLKDNKFSSVEGGISGLLQGLCHLKHMDLQSNDILESLPTNFSVCGKHELEFLLLNDNKISGGLEWLENFISLQMFDISSNSISGNLPSSIGLLSSLEELVLSHNHLSGPIPPFLGRMSFLEFLLLSNNHFNDTIPSSLMMSSSLLFLDLSNNDLTGVQLEFSPKKSVPLSNLILGRNHLAGAIPNSLCHLYQLYALDLRDNRFSGRVPICLWKLPQLYDLNLSNNTIEGELPSMIKSKSLQTLDLGDNHFYGEIPSSWNRRSFVVLEILRLRSNNITGTFPPQLCSLYTLHILDVGNNNLSGGIPECFGSFSGMQIRGSVYFPVNGFSLFEVMKGAEREYTTGYLVNMDLSNNNLSGPIPTQLTWLHGLIGLNLSHNQLTGPIPSRIDNMTYLESLDLSNNNIQGSIPQSLDKLTSLSYLNLSHNKLQGPIPTGSQLRTLTDPSIYAGNVNLCGDILSKKCTEDDHEKKPADDKKDEDEADDRFEKLWFVIFTVFGGIAGFWGVIGILLAKKNWRYTYFRLADIIAHWIGGRWIKKVK